MSDDNEPRRGESQAVVLARVEGLIKVVDVKLDNVLGRMTKAESRLDKHDDDLESVRLTMQQIAAEAKARADAQAAAALAVKETRQTDRDADEKRWAPKARFWTTALSVATVASALVTILALTHHL